MPETEPQMLARLEVLAQRRLTVLAWGDELSPDDIAAIRRALAMLKQYRGALEELIPVIHSALDHEQPASPNQDGLCGNDNCLRCVLGWIIHQALSPDPPAPAETEVTDAR
ncbi:MAG: hypothetical protein V1790_17410 [Planctomycetota bacterium]